MGEVIKAGEMREVGVAQDRLWNLARLEEVIKSQKDNIALINGVPEITRPIAIELFNQVRMQALRAGLALREKADVIHKDADSVIVEFRIAVYQAKDPDGNPLPADKMPLLYEIAEIGEAHRDEKGKEFTFIRTAYTRAMKRALERLVGEDFINKVVLSLVKRTKPATEKQINFIRKLLKAKGIPEERFAKKLENLTFDEATNLINKLKEN